MGLLTWRRRTDRRGATAAKSRDPHWDNVRAISGTLVVFGHLTDTITDRDGLRWLQIATWALRVPVFVMVAGYFSRADALTPREARRLTESILVPYLAIGLLHSAEQYHFYDNWSFSIAQPHWAMWFLLSLLFWRAGLPYLAQLRYPLATSVAVALAAGYISEFGGYLSLSRTLCFLPFFLLGWRLRQGLLADALTARWSRHAAIAVLAVTFVTAWFIRHEVPFSWLRMSSAYDGTYELPRLWDWTIRLGVLVLGTVIALAFIRLTPRGRVPLLTYLGTGGLYIYLLHPLVLRPLLRWFGVDWVGPWPEQLSLVLFTVALTIVLGSPPVRRLARPFVQPRLPWLFRAEPDAPAPARTVPAPAAAPDDQLVRVPGPR
ncbi:acyltransferase family protein [Streptomyces litchfieldiae]|uniref:Acyltransferase family protein n=1 Tax=Streptomyces litchfieldiae TaxID=3075543 RepID=A0ABU2MN94_9ACTN|nr:acyltransferase family protein [Streptomyces sp. DSM 44938]MDT0342808.1 acyltransferase family protein [Streptomyces sp. DSM 44938]